MNRTDYLYILVDASNSMQGSKIGAVNDAINNIIHRLKKTMGSMGLEIKIVLMTFSDTVQWSSVLPISINSFSFEDLSTSGKSTKLGEALNELFDKLQKQESVRGNVEGETTIVLFTDGLPTDDYSEALTKLNKNRVYTGSNRIGFTFKDELCEDLAREVLADFVSGEDKIIVEDFVQLIKMLFEKYK